MISTLLLATLLFGATKDPFPNACADCHIKTRDGKDVRISTLLKRPDPGAMARLQAITPKGRTLKGVHPPVPFPIRFLPQSCTTCHTAGARNLPPFGAMMHTIHLAGEKNQFVVQFGGECGHCHKLDVALGKVFLPNGTEK